MQASPLTSPFGSFFLGGFECSSHRRNDGRRLDLLAMTGHDRFVAQDYAALRQHGIAGARDGLRWHLIETSPGRYDWSSALPMIRAARERGVRIAWDLCHYGWPDDIDIWSAAFVERFACFAAAAARLMRDEGVEGAVYCPINEISFWAWAGAEVGRFNPSVHGRGGDLKRQLVRAAVAATRAIRDVDASARFITAEPLIHVDPGLGDEEHRRGAETYRLSQYEALDLLSGAREPELGGGPDCLDIVGVNYYPDNQWYYGGPTIPLGHHAYRPLSEMLAEAHRRYGRPLVLAETGAEGRSRPAWLHYVCAEIEAALDEGVPVLGACLYPILDYPGWDNERVCQVGLFSTPDTSGERPVCAPLARELQRQQAILEEARIRHAPAFAQAAE
ncbi:MAG TPA: beta-glucosidase [Beijerinckiaceae bacterium]